MKQRRLNRHKRTRQERKQRKHNSEVTSRTSIPCAQDESMNTDNAQPGKKSMLSIYVIRGLGFVPMVALVVILAATHLYANPFPWFQPIIDNQIAILTLTAGHAAIMGILIGKNLSGLSTVALLTAALATYLAGYQAIGEDIAGHVLTIVLFLSAILGIFAECIVTVVKKVWSFAWSRKGLAIISMVVAIVVATYNQLRNENYFINWILIPLAAIFGFVVLVAISWLLIKLSAKHFRSAYSWLKRRIRYIYNWLIRHKPS